MALLYTMVQLPSYNKHIQKTTPYDPVSGQFPQLKPMVAAF